MATVSATKEEGTTDGGAPAVPLGTAVAVGVGVAGRPNNFSLSQRDYEGPSSVASDHSSSVDAERGNVSDDFEENVKDANADAAAAQQTIRPSPTWLSSGDEFDCAFPSPSEDSFKENDRDAVNNSSAEATRNNNERLLKVVKAMAVALVLFFAIVIALSVALIIVSKKGNASEETSTSAIASIPIEEAALEMETKETFPVTDETTLVSETTSFNNVTLSVPITIPTASNHPTFSSSVEPSNHPSPSPTENPTSYPSLNPSSNPSSAPVDPFYFGDLSIIDDELGLQISAGLSVKLIAKAGERVDYSNGQSSEERFHDLLDGAGVIPVSDGGYVYVSNAEVGKRKGGVYGLYFDKDGSVKEYKPLLEGTTDNCGGGLTPWNTWISCEEYDEGQCWQIDPDPSSPNHNNPRETALGDKDGGTYESVAVDNRRPERPIFFVTEDLSDGALRRIQIDGSGWDSLHDEDIATTSFLHILDDSRFKWTDDEDDGRDSAEDYFPNAEGISFQEEEGKLYFMSKERKTMLILDLENLTYESETTGKKFYGEGSFAAQPDQSVLGPRHRHMYFTEDGGSSPGVYARLGSTGVYYTMFQGMSSKYDGDESVGVALSPDGTKFYAGIQDAGVLFEFRRDDGLPFE